MYFLLLLKFAQLDNFIVWDISHTSLSLGLGYGQFLSAFLSTFVGVAEWSKALVLSTSSRDRGFESRRSQKYFVEVWKQIFCLFSPELILGHPQQPHTTESSDANQPL